MKNEIPWCDKKQEACKYIAQLRHIGKCELTCKHLTTILGSCDTCKFYRFGINDEMKWNGIKTPMHYCATGDDLNDGCERYKPINI